MKIVINGDYGGFGYGVVEVIPDTATDYEITDYDGLESLLYVVDGKIHHA